ncbi:MAG: hypothetical protein E6G51_12705 [Actinobacteria bacterium]|nr:MAG: hypothetical protein E6G51_12705 [Actinomycetota bacterium]
MLREKALALGRFALINADGVLVVLVAFGVVALQIVGNPSSEVVSAAILSLLGTMAIVLLRNRAARDEFSSLRQLADDAINDRPYQVVWQTVHWDLHDRHNTTVKNTEQLRFTRNDVATNFHWSSGDGTVQRTVARWQREDGKPWIEAKKVYEFPVRNGIKTIFCYDEEHSRGDMLNWCIERETVDRFPTSHEGVEFTPRVKADHPRVAKISWPRDSPPTHVEMRRGSGPAQPLTVQQENGRSYVEVKILGQAIGEDIRIDWTW